jgi:hypothetical protein
MLMKNYDGFFVWFHVWFNEKRCGSMQLMTLDGLWSFVVQVSIFKFCLFDAFTG